MMRWVVFILIAICLVLACNPESKKMEVQVGFDTPQNYVFLDAPYAVLEKDIFEQDGSPYSGYLKNTPGKSPKFLFAMKDGKQNGIQKGWHPNGKLSYEYVCVKGERQNLYEEFYPNGQKQILIEYVGGKEKAKTVWDYEGKVIVNYVIKDGRYYGLLGSSQCMTIFNEEKSKAKLKE